jgi:hypothetical protein
MFTDQEKVYPLGRRFSLFALRIYANSMYTATDPKLTTTTCLLDPDFEANTVRSYNMFKLSNTTTYYGRRLTNPRVMFA